MNIQIVSNLFPDLAGQFDQMTEDALDTAVLTCIEVADGVTPVDTGALRANKTIEGGDGSRTITWNADYAAHVEMGTFRMGAQPFAQPGADAALPVLMAGLKGFG